VHDRIAVNRSKPSSAAPCALFAAATAGLAGAVYWFSAGTAAGRDIDAYLLRHGSHGIVEAIGDTLVFLAPPTAALGALALFGTAWRAGRRGDAIRAVAIIAGAPVVARVAKMLLEDRDPLGTEASRQLGTGFFPSGHAAIVMALCLAALLVAPWPRRRLLLAAGVYASALGFAIAAGRSHHLSDVYGAFLLAAAVAALGLVRRTPPRGEDPNAGAGLAVAHIVIVIAAIIAGILLLESWRIAGEPHDLAGLTATATAASASAFLILAGYERLLRRTAPDGGRICAGLLRR